MSRGARFFLVAEVVVCFLPITLVLVLGVIMVPLQVGLLVGGEPFAFVTIAVVAAGIGGLVALNSVLRWVLVRPVDSLNPKVVRVLTFLGLLAIVPFAMGDEPLMGVLPLICSAHLLYLAREYVFRSAGPGSGDVPAA